MVKLSTINQVVQGIYDGAKSERIGLKYKDNKVEANEAAIILYTAFLAETRGIDKALEYYLGTHDDKEYVQWLTSVTFGGDDGK